jgi:hypothetical protein
MTSPKTILSSGSPASSAGLSLLLSSIVASVAGGCGDAIPAEKPTSEVTGSGGSQVTESGDGDSAQSETGGSGTTNNEPHPEPDVPDPDVPHIIEGEPVTLVCVEGSPSLTDGLDPAIEIDSFTHYVAQTSHLCTPPDTYAAESTVGVPCTNADDESSCLSEVERLVQGSADWGKYEDFWTASWGLLVATGSKASIEQLGGPVEDLNGDQCGSWTRGSTETLGDAEPFPSGFGGAGGAPPYDVPVQSDHATKIQDRQTLLRLLGEIDTPNEAALVLWAHDYSPTCNMVRTEAGYATQTTEQVSDCPFTYQNYEVHVSREGVVTSGTIGEPWESGAGCAGRRPAGLVRGGSGSKENPTARILAKIARLEGAAVVAFAQLSRELERLGAPADLVQRAQEAALDEIRHAREVSTLSEAHGHQVAPVVVERVGERTLLSLAVENAVEGCVRECWGALVAHFQAQHAKDPAVRKVWATIAEEETGHAVLSADIGRWLVQHLSEAEQQTVSRAYDQAILELREEVAQSSMECEELGFPDRQTGLLLFAQLESRVFDLNRPTLAA